MGQLSRPVVVLPRRAPLLFFVPPLSSGRCLCVSNPKREFRLYRGTSGARGVCSLCLNQCQRSSLNGQWSCRMTMDQPTGSRMLRMCVCVVKRARGNHSIPWRDTRPLALSISSRCTHHRTDIGHISVLDDGTGASSPSRRISLKWSLCFAS
jgi:hypothetical protein